MAHGLQDDINALFQWLDYRNVAQPEEAQPGGNGESGESEAEGAITETIHVYFVRESELVEPADEQLVESTLVTGDTNRLHHAPFAGEPQQTHTPVPPEVAAPAPLLEVRTRTSLTYCTVGVGVMLLLTSIVFQMVLLVLTPTATVALVPVVRNLSTTLTILAGSGTLTRGHIPARLLPAFTLTQTTTVPATGKGHQDAEAAMGTITFYNGLFTSQTIATGTTLTGSDGIQVVTDQLAVIPAATASTPPIYGQVTVSAHAIDPGPQGNIPAGDINEACCLPSVLAQNTAAFQGGQNERDYTVVTREDIDHTVASLTTTLKQSGRAAFTAQLRAGEALATPSCTRRVASDHQVGEEAVGVAVTVSEQCTAVAYNAAALKEQATQVFTRELAQREGVHYRLVGAVQVSILHARIIDQKGEVASLTLRIAGTSIYQFSQQQLQQIKQLVAGKTLTQGVHILLGLPGVQRATITGINPNTSLPKDSSHIQVRIKKGSPN